MLLPYLKPETAHVLSIPPVNWSTWVEHNFLEAGQASKLYAIATELEELAQMAVMLANYIGWRGGHGCGDQGHDKAVKACNKRLKAVRKAMGYTLPASGCFTF